jgi:hypothetical protein
MLPVSIDKKKCLTLPLPRCSDTQMCRFWFLFLKFAWLALKNKLFLCASMKTFATLSDFTEGRRFLKSIPIGFKRFIKG